MTNKWLLSPATASSFALADIAGLQLWLDPTDNATITLVSGKASQWNDKSSAANNATQSNATYRFTPTAATINGLQVMSTPAVTSYVANTGMAVTLSGGALTAFSFGMLVQPLSVTEVFTALLGNSGTGNITIETNGADATKLDAYINNVGASGATSTGVFNTGSTYFLFATYSTPTLTIYINNSSVLSTTTNLTSRQIPAAISVGGSTSVAGFKPVHAYIGDVFIYNTALGTTDRNSIYNSFMKTRWGLP